MSQDFQSVGIPKGVEDALTDASLGELSTKFERFLRKATHPDRTGIDSSYTSRLSESEVRDSEDASFASLEIKSDRIHTEIRDISRLGSIGIQERLRIGRAVMEYVLSFEIFSKSVMEDPKPVIDLYPCTLELRDLRYYGSSINIAYRDVDESVVSIVDRRRREIRKSLAEKGKTITSRELSDQIDQELEERLRKVYHISNDGIVTESKDGREIVHHNKHLIGSMRKDDIIFLDRVVLGDYDPTHNTGRDESKKKKELAFTEECRREPIYGTPSQHAHSRFVGEKSYGEYDFEPLKLEMDKFWRVVAGLKPYLLKGEAVYLFSFNTPESEPPYFEIEGEILEIRPTKSGEVKEG